MKRKMASIMTLAGAIAILSACGGGGGGTAPQGGTPGTGLSVVSITPSANATGVVRSTAITATFSSALDCTTVILSSITVTDAGGNAVPGAVGCSGENAGFTPAASLTGDILYTVSVSGTIKDGAGNALSGDYTWSFTTKAQGWGTSSAVDSALTASQSSWPYSLGTDAQGHARVIYSVSDGASSSMSSKSYVPGAGWAPAVSMGSPNFGSYTFGSFKANAAGDAVAVWRESGFVINAGYYSLSSGWTYTQISNNTNGSVANLPAVAIDPNGNAIAVWQQGNGPGNRYSIFSSRYTPAGGWSAAERLDSGALPQWDTIYANIGMDSNGNGIALWSENTGVTNYRLQSRRFDLSTGWTNTWHYLSDNTTVAFNSQIAFDGSGNALVVWQQNDGTFNTYPNPDHERYSVYVRRYTPAEGWDATAGQFGKDIPANGGDSVEPKIAMAANGKAVAVWRFKRDASNFTHYYDIYAAHFDGSNWHAGNPPLYWTVVSGEEFSGFSSDTQGPNVTIDSSGRETLVWYKAVDSTPNYAIYSMNYTPGAGWNTRTTLGTTTNAYPVPMVVADDAGVVTAVWDILDGSRYVMWSNQND